MSCAETRPANGARPAADSAQAWAAGVIGAATLASKLQPGPCPVHFAPGAEPLGGVEPSRPEPLRVIERSPRTPRPGALLRKEVRAKLLHTFAHHELQAAEIFCWAFLAFPEQPEAFRRGLLQIAADELRHAREYIAEVERLGSFFGADPVRDWFWQRFRTLQSPLEFVSLMGIGFEGGNLDHCALWAQRFRAVGDEGAARCQEKIGREEEGHVAFAVHWYERLAGELTFERWRAALPAPLTPTVLRGAQLNRAARGRAGLGPDFQDGLDAWNPRRPGS